MDAPGSHFPNLDFCAVTCAPRAQKLSPTQLETNNMPTNATRNEGSNPTGGKLLFLLRLFLQLTLQINGYSHSTITVKTMYSDYEHYLLVRRTVSCTSPSK